MCFSQRVSWGAFIFGIISSIALLLWATTKNWIELQLIALWLIFVVTIQFFEALAWMGYNKIGAYGILTFIPIQPIVLALLLLLIPNIPIQFKVITIVLISIYLIYLIDGMNSIPRFDSLTTTENCSHLVQTYWNNLPLKGFPYMLMMFIVPLLLLPTKMALTLITLEIITLSSAYLVYPCSVGSLWCLFAVFAPIITLLLAYANVITP